MGRKRNKRRPPPDRPWHPLNWGQWVVVALLWVLGRLPPRLALGLGSALGTAGHALARERRAIARRNLELCFPEKPAAERDALLRANFRAMGRAVAETALAWFGGRRVDRLPMVVRGEAHVEAARAAGEPVIFLSGHFLCVELAARLLPDRIPVAAMYKPMHRRPVLDAAMLRARQRNVTDAVSKDDMRGIMRTLRRGTPIWFAGDQDYGRRHSVEVPFFGIPAPTITALARLSRMSRARVIPLHFFREADGRYAVEFQAPLEGFPSGDDTADAARMNRIIEADARRHPEQYLWIHRRFKTAADYPPGRRQRRRR